jgi:putative transposase
MLNALASRCDLKDLIFHCFNRPQLIHLSGCLRQATSSLGCDRGIQYGSRAFRELLRPHGVRQSMSARAKPDHNAWTEPERSGDRLPQAALRVSEANQSFMGTLKAEMLQNGCFMSTADAEAEFFAFIDRYYNTQRLHSSLNHQTPHHFESQIALGN